MASRMPGLLRLCVPIWQIRLYLRAAAVMIAPSCTLCVAGFSQYTSLPFSMAQTAMSACQWLGVAMETMSMSLSSTTLRMSFSNFGGLALLVVDRRHGGADDGLVAVADGGDLAVVLAEEAGDVAHAAAADADDGDAEFLD